MQSLTAHLVDSQAAVLSHSSGAYFNHNRFISVVYQDLPHIVLPAPQSLGKKSLAAVCSPPSKITTELL